MIIKLLPNQIERYWEIIKYSAVKADEVEEKNIGAYSIDLLFDLLNEKSLCILCCNKDKKEIQKVLIVSFFLDEIQKEKVMELRTLYSFAHTKAEDWADEIIQVCNFAIKEKCNSIQMNTKNKTIIRLGEQYGMKEITRRYKLSL